MTSQAPQAITNPLIIVGVLSDSTSAFDHGVKWTQYQSIDSLSEYLLVWQDRPLVEHYTRQGKAAWKYESIEGLGKTVELPSLEGEIAISDLYLGVEFPETPLLRKVSQSSLNDEEQNGNP